MLVVDAAKDKAAPVQNILSLRDELGDQVRLVEIAGAGHCVQSEWPLEVEAAVLAWLSGHQNA
jgi:pimeloyl-ACP methyl ester carboxylesterase